MDLIFNIIFMPGTVRYLRLAVLSLLQCSNYRYRLVANGLGRSELTLLRSFCDSSDRLLFFAYPGKAPLPHGVLLSLLQQRERGARFCFMDSDIFAAAPFQAELEAHLGRCDVFSSCDVVRKDDSRAPGYAARCLESPCGLPLATSYLAVYRNEPLQQVIRETGVGFEVYYFAEQYPRSIRARLDQLGASDAVTCDTGKVLNVLSHAYGLKYRYAEIDSLRHIGGITKAFAKRGWLKERLARFLNRSYVLSDRDLQPRGPRSWHWITKAFSHADDLREPSPSKQRRERLRRRRVASFFGFFLLALLDGTPEPVLALSDTTLADDIASLCDVIRSINNEYRSALAA